MEYVSLGKSGLRVSRLAFGCEPLGGCDWGSVDVGEVERAIRRSLDLGVTFFDTADVYGLGLSEERLARALGRERKKVVIATKVGIRWESRPNQRAHTLVDLRPAHVMAAVEASLRRLQLDCIPLCQIHRPDTTVSIADTMAALMSCQQQGKIRHIGVSNFEAEDVCTAERFVRLVSNQVPFSLIQRAAETSIFPQCEVHGVSVIAYGVLAQGLLSGKYRADAKFDVGDRRQRLPQFQTQAFGRVAPIVARVCQFAAERGVTAAQVALRWVLNHPAVGVAIAGIKSQSQLEDNCGVFDWTIAAEDWQLLSAATAVSQ